MLTTSGVPSSNGAHRSVSQWLIATATAVATVGAAMSMTACLASADPLHPVASRRGDRSKWTPPFPAGAVASTRKLPIGTSRQSAPFEDARAEFSVQVQEVESSYRTTPVFVLPGQEIAISARAASAPVQAAAEAGQLRIDGPGAWTWTAPDKPGTSACIRLTEQRHLDSICVKAFVLQPYHGEDKVDGFHIGHYQRAPLKGDVAYTMPQGLVRVTADNIEEPVSPHFRLGQFLCKQEGGYPKFVVLKTALLVKLEMLLDKLASDGVVADTLHVMSGYRTPAYNAAIGNETIYSRHSYGDAADVYVDRDGDGIMDDIDGDGRSSTADARQLYGIVNDVLDATASERLAGGLAVYAPNGEHGPFVHVDTRGHLARW